ncbi:MAG: hypothetical protein NVSMB64_23100 [Candidatus Velthaea sp.]
MLRLVKWPELASPSTEYCVPLYDYQCEKCKKVTEVRHNFREKHAQPCPECGGQLARVFNPAGIVFKGSGFYITDSRKAGDSGAASASSDSPAPSTPSKPSDTKKSDAPAA